MYRYRGLSSSTTEEIRGEKLAFGDHESLSPENRVHYCRHVRLAKFVHVHSLLYILVDGFELVWLHFLQS